MQQLDSPDSTAIGPDASEAPEAPEAPEATDSATAIQCRRRDIDEIDKQIVSLSHSINAHNYQLLVLIREFDERAGWLGCGLSNCVQWLAWRCDLSEQASRERIRIAHALKVLPAISKAFASGALSYSKVRALTRIATKLDEAELLEMAMKMTAAHVEQHCQQRRNGSPDSRRDAAGAYASRALWISRDASRGTMKITIEVPLADGLLFEKAIDNGCADRQSSHEAPDEEPCWSALRADAALTIARTYLAGGAAGGAASVPARDSAETFGAAGVSDGARQSGAKTAQTSAASTSTADQYLVTIHVDHEALAGRGGQSEMPIDTARRLCCDGSIVGITEGRYGEPLNVGRKQRVVTTGIRRALFSRDKGCTFPGCSHTRFVDAHHVKHWADGGETSVDNMVLLCTKHHRLVHEGGYRIRCDHGGKRYFQRPDGRAVPECGYNKADWEDDYSQNDPAAFGSVPAEAFMAMDSVVELIPPDPHPRAAGSPSGPTKSIPWLRGSATPGHPRSHYAPSH